MRGSRINSQIKVDYKDSNILNTDSSKDKLDSYSDINMTFLPKYLRNRFTLCTGWLRPTQPYFNKYSNNNFVQI